MEKRAFAAVLAAGAILAACAADPPRPATPEPELVIPPMSTKGSSSTSSSGGGSTGLVFGASGGTRCSAQVTTGSLSKSSPSCVLDEFVSERVGTLTYPCGGSGAVEVAFEQQVFRGELNADGDVDLESIIDGEQADGCTWSTVAKIRGTLLTSEGKLARRRLSWSLAEHLVRGSNCYGRCTATAMMDVRPSRSP